MPLEFDLDRKETPVFIRDPKTNTREQFVLVETDGKGRDKFLEAVGQTVELDPTTGEPSRVKTLVGIETTLVVACLSRVNDDGTRTPVTAEWVDTLPSRIRTGLFDEAKRLSGLDKEAEAAAKNGSSGANEDDGST